MLLWRSAPQSLASRATVGSSRHAMTSLWMTAHCTPCRALVLSSPLLAVKKMVRKKKLVRRRGAAPVRAAQTTVISEHQAAPLRSPPAAAPPSTPSASPEPIPTPPSPRATTPAGADTGVLAPLSRRLDKLTEMAHQLERSLRACSEATGLAQRQLTVVDRRVLTLEQSTEALQASLAAVQRSVGEVVLQQRNTELLVRQMETRVLHGGEAAQPAVGKGKGNEVGTSDGSKPGSATWELMTEEALPARVSALIQAAVEKAVSDALLRNGSGTTRGSGATAPPHSHHDASLTRLSADVAKLRETVTQLSLDHLALQRVVPAVVAEITSRTDQDKQAGAGSGDGSGGSGGLISQVAALVHATASRPQKDVTGATVPHGERIVVRNVPRSLSAAEMRALCSAKLGPGGAGRILSCAVAPHTLPPSLQPSSRRAEQEGSTEKTGGMTDAVGLPRAASLARVAIVPGSKVFEVVFDSAATASRALVALNRTALRPAAHLPSQPLVAEPAVSAELLDAWTRATTPAGGGPEKASS